MTPIAPPLARRSLWLFIGVCMVAFTIWSSLSPLEKIPKVPGSDKTHHFVAYGAMTWWWCQLMSRRWAVVVGMVALGVAIEVLQPIVANRFFEWEDMAANTFGAILGLLAMRTPAARAIAWLDERVSRR